MVHVLNKISSFLPFMLTDAFLDVFIQSWQFRRGVVSFAEVVSSGHHVQYLCWYRFLVESGPCIFLPLVSVDPEYQDGWCALNSSRIWLSCVVQKVFYRRLIPIAAWGNVDVGNDQLRVPNFSFYGKFFQVGDHIATANDGCLEKVTDLWMKISSPPPWP